MFSLQKLLGKGDQFFALFEAAMGEALRCASLLQAILDQPDNDALLSDLRAARAKNKDICEKVSELLVSTFVTALEREDIEALADILYRLPKPIEKFAMRFRLAKEFTSDVDFRPQAEIVLRSFGIVAEMVAELKKGAAKARVSALNTRLQSAEAEADELEDRLLLSLYSTRTNSLRVLIAKDLYEMLEKAIDRARDVGTLINHIVLKNT